MKIAVAGIEYVGLSMAILLAQRHPVIAVDIVPEKVGKINNHKGRFYIDLCSFQS